MIIYIYKNDTVVRKELSSQTILGYIMWFPFLRLAMMKFYHGILLTLRLLNILKVCTTFSSIPTFKKTIYCISPSKTMYF